MELNLEQARISGFETVFNTTAFQEETMEMIVPDACPDILSIIDTEGRITLARKEVLDGRVELSGIIRTAILYLPEGGGGIRRLDASIPFTCAAEGTEISRDCRIHVVPAVNSAETKILNPRKVLIRAEGMLECTVYRAQEQCVASGVSGQEDCCVQQRCEEKDTYTITCVASHPFGMTDGLELTASKPDAAELLKCRAIPRCSESKVIGNKLIIKGEVRLVLLYRGIDDALCTTEFDLPFSQIMEVSNCTENSDCALSVVVTKLECTLDPVGEGRTFQLELELCAQAVLREICHMTLLQDLYSTTRATTLTTAEHTLRVRGDQGMKSQLLQEVLETPQLIRSIDDVYFLPGGITQRAEEGHRVLLLAGTLNVLGRCEDGSVVGLSRPIRTECPLEAGEQEHCECSCRLGGDILALPTAGGIEVRLPLEFCYTTYEEIQTAAIGRVEIAEEDALCENRPSVVLRMVSPQEGLWDLAKCYRTTEQAIIQANALDSGPLPAGKLLLIPGRR